MKTAIVIGATKENQYKIDCTYPYEVGKIAKINGVKQYILVSSVGANFESSNFYLRTKGDLEKKIQSLDFQNFVSVRPSMLLGDREESRLGEKIGKVLSNLLSPLLFGSLRKYHGIEAADVAKAMQRFANQGLSGVKYVEYDDIMNK